MKKKKTIHWHFAKNQWRSNRINTDTHTEKHNIVNLVTAKRRVFKAARDDTMAWGTSEFSSKARGRKATGGCPGGLVIESACQPGGMGLLPRGMETRRPCTTAAEPALESPQAATAERVCRNRWSPHVQACGIIADQGSNPCHIQLFTTLWTVAHQAPLSMKFSRQEYWLEWVAISSSRGSFWPRDWICIFCVPCTGRRILYHWTTWEASFADDMILYIDATRQLLELINEFGKVSGYKINTQKSVVFLYTNNERSKREIQETVLCIVRPKRIK